MLRHLRLYVICSRCYWQLLQEIFKKNPAQWGPDKVVHTVVPDWYRRPGYIKVMAKLILEQVVQFSEEDMREGLHVLFSAHGVPESYILGKYHCMCVVLLL